MNVTLLEQQAQTDFDAIAEIYDGVFASHITEHYLSRRARYLLELMPRGDALDVGAGTGMLAERLSTGGLNVVALDPFPQMLEQLRQRRPEISTVVGEGEAIPFADASFDLVYSVAVLHHIATPERVRRTLREMVRVTRPGGKIVVWDHNPLNPYWPWLMRRVPQDSGAERLIPRAEIIAGLKGAGARVVRPERLGLLPEFVPARLMPLATAMERVVEATPGLRNFCAHNVVLATRP
jgi:ubiquinone/menaquinone biosynthesis C-methylase UbiE